jgi:hypothetical protein
VAAGPRRSRTALGGTVWMLNAQAHAVWFGAAIIIVGVAFLAKHKMRSFLYSPNRWEVLWSLPPRYEGRTLAEWLPV